MADATLPEIGTYFGGHVPFWMRVNRALENGGRVIELVDVDGQLVTIREDGHDETLWTHAPAAQALEEGLRKGLRGLSRFGDDLVIANGYAFSLIDPSEATRCAATRECRHGRVVSVHTGKPWSTEDTLRRRRDS